MMDTAGDTNRGFTRRQILGAAVASLSLVAVAPPLFGGKAQAQQKVSKAMVHYQDSPKHGQECVGCANFIPPHDCKVVAGPISPRGWCELWVPK
jgi:hypothetical protein